MKSFVETLHENSDLALKKHQDNFPSGAEISLQLLKGHLLIEELLRDIVLAKVARPEVIDASNAPSFSCSQVICLAEALCPSDPDGAWIWEAVRKLNAARNKLAHRLDYKILNDDVGKFIAYCTESRPDIVTDMEELEMPKDSLFECCIMSMSTFILAFRARPPNNSFKSNLSAGAAKSA